MRTVYWFGLRSLTLGACWIPSNDSSTAGIAGAGGTSASGGAGQGGAAASAGSSGSAGMQSGSAGATGGGGATGTSGAPSGSAGAPGGAGAPGSAGAVGASGAGGASAGAGGNAGASGGTAGHSGSGGSGGSGAGTATCSDKPLSQKSSWVLSASSSDTNAPATNTVDGNLSTRWTTGKDQGSDWFQIDFGVDVTLDTVSLALGDSAGDYPRAYQARFSEMPNNMALTPQVTGSGQQAMTTVIKFPHATSGRYLLLTQTGSATGTWWSIAELAVTCGG